MISSASSGNVCIRASSVRHPDRLSAFAVQPPSDYRDISEGSGSLPLTLSGSYPLGATGNQGLSGYSAPMSAPPIPHDLIWQAHCTSIQPYQVRFQPTFPGYAAQLATVMMQMFQHFQIPGIQAPPLALVSHGQGDSLLCPATRSYGQPHGCGKIIVPAQRWCLT